MSAAFNRRVIPAGAIESSWIAGDGHPIRRIDWTPAKVRGSILFLSGRGDFYEKYLEAMAHWHDRNWAVTAFDWRGQGGSGRLGLDPNVWFGNVDQLVANEVGQGPINYVGTIYKYYVGYRFSLPQIEGKAAAIEAAQP